MGDLKKDSILENYQYYKRKCVHQLQSMGSMDERNGEGFLVSGVVL